MGRKNKVEIRIVITMKTLIETVGRKFYELYVKKYAHMV